MRIACKVSRVVQVSLSFFLFRLVLADLIFSRDVRMQTFLAPIYRSGGQFFSYVEHVRDGLSPEDTPVIPCKRRSSPGPRRHVGQNKAEALVAS